MSPRIYVKSNYLVDEALHLSASGKFAKEESRREDHYRLLQGVHLRPQKGPFRLRGCSL